MNKMSGYDIQLLYIFPVFMFLYEISCFPIDKTSAITIKPELKDETQYPNGTVVGKYSYKDNAGNPINVKYYADKSGYGVELNSFKIIETITARDALIHTKTTDYIKPVEPLFNLASEIMSFRNDKQTNKPDAVVTGKVSHMNHAARKTAKESSPYYETFYQNELKAPKQCEKDRVKIYLVKEKRKTRSSIEDDSGEYCGRF